MRGERGARHQHHHYENRSMVWRRERDKLPHAHQRRRVRPNRRRTHRPIHTEIHNANINSEQRRRRRRKFTIRSFFATIITSRLHKSNHYVYIFSFRSHEETDRRTSLVSRTQRAPSEKSGAQGSERATKIRGKIYAMRQHHHRTAGCLASVRGGKGRLRMSAHILRQRIEKR